MQSDRAGQFLREGAEKEMEKSIKKAGDVFAVFCALLILWLLVSFAEVNAKNLTENPTYSDYNFFAIICEL